MKIQHLYLTTKDNLRSWKWWSSWLTIIFGCTVLSLGFILFMYPYNITPGGIWGLSAILHAVFPSIPVGWFGYAMEVPLLLTGFAVFGPVFGTRTVFASLLTPLLMLLLPMAVYPDTAVQTAETLLWGKLNLADDLILATIFGGIFIGIGAGTVMRMQATTGGTDIIGLLFQKYLGIKFSNGILIADGLVVLTGLIVLVVFKGESPTLPLYSMLTLYIATQVIDLVVEGRNFDKILFIVSNRQDEIKEFILKDLDRSGTVIKSSGLYTGEGKNMIFLVVSRREIVPVKQRLREIDPAMFVVVVDANETLGEGFRHFSDMKTL